MNKSDFEASEKYWLLPTMLEKATYLRSLGTADLEKLNLDRKLVKEFGIWIESGEGKTWHDAIPWGSK